MGSGASTVYDKSVVDEMTKHVDSDVVILGGKDTTDSKVSFKIVTTCFGLLFWNLKHDLLYFIGAKELEEAKLQIKILEEVSFHW